MVRLDRLVWWTDIQTEQVSEMWCNQPCLVPVHLAAWLVPGVPGHVW